MDSIIELFAVKPEFAWGPAVPQYFFLTGISAAAFLIASLAYVFGDKRFQPIAGLSLIVALTVLLAAPLNLIADLEQPGRFYSLFFRRHLTSPMSWGVFLLTIYPLLIAAEGIFAFRAGFAQRGARAGGWQRQLYRLLALGELAVTPRTQARDHRIGRSLGILGIPTALAVHGYTGFILYFVVGRPLWNTPLMPIIFLVSAAVSGLALMILLAWLMVRDAHGQRLWSLIDRLGVLLGWTIVVDLALRGAWHGLSYWRAPQTYAPVLTFLFRERFVESVVLEAGLSLLMPALVLLLPPLRRQRPLVLLAASLAVAGVWLFRWSTVIGGQEIPKVAAGYYHYTPDLWGGKGLMQVVANWAFWVLLFMVFTWILPWQAESAPEQTVEILPSPVPADVQPA